METTTPYSPCDICIEETCEGRRDCKCSTCKLVSKCHRHLHATIRITNRCTQECQHCGFSSSPKSNIMMSIQQSEKIAEFIRNNNVETLNLMGGEFFCNPDWFQILSNLVEVSKYSRLVTNGDWAHNDKVKEQLSKLFDQYKHKLKLSVSKDRWHTNKNVDAAAQFLQEQRVTFNMATEKETTENSIVPIGRGTTCSGYYYSMFGCFCRKPEEHYSFLIDEDGNIYKCGFGVFPYATIDEYINGGFRQRFKEFNKVFYSKFIPSCQTCVTFATLTKGKDGQDLIVRND